MMKKISWGWFAIGLLVGIPAGAYGVYSYARSRFH